MDQLKPRSLNILCDLENWHNYYNNMFKKTGREFYEKKVEEYEELIAIEELRLSPTGSSFGGPLLGETTMTQDVTEGIKQLMNNKSLKKNADEKAKEEYEKYIDSLMRMSEGFIEKCDEKLKTTTNKLKSTSPLAWDELEKEMLKQKKDKDGS